MHHLVYKVKGRPDIGYRLLTDYSVRMWGQNHPLKKGDIILDRKNNRTPTVEFEILKPYEFLCNLNGTHSMYGQSISIERNNKNEKDYKTK